MTSSYRTWHPVEVIPSQSKEKPRTGLQLRESDARALQAVNEGIASPDQQKMAMAAVIWICETHDLGFLPEEHGGERDTLFKHGKQHVGFQLRKLVSTPLHLLTGETNDRTNSGTGRTGGRGGGRGSR